MECDIRCSNFTFVFIIYMDCRDLDCVWIERLFVQGCKVAQVWTECRNPLGFIGFMIKKMVIVWNKNL